MKKIYNTWNNIINFKISILKKFLFFFAASLISLSSYSQTFVSTTPENKNIILEEFTGISCGYCPDGHRIGQDLHDANPNDVFLINIHTGSYATPQGPGTDFNTSFGSGIAGQTDLQGYPAGTINRHLFAGLSQQGGAGTAMSRGDWTSAANQLLIESSPVNVGLQASVDMATNTLTVDVEVYYTGTQTISTNALNIAVVQDNIEGPQSGMSANPNNVLPNGNYNHQHMLRHLITGQWGETISNISSGTLYTNQYTWVMPALVGDVALDPTNISIIAFVSEGQQEILSGTETSPNIIFVNQNDAYCMSTSANDAICSESTSIEVTFRNYGSLPLTSLDINYSINGGATNTYPWTGNLAPAGTETINIPAVGFTPQATNSLTVSTSNPNGTTDQNTLNDQSTNTFNQYLAGGNITNGIIPGSASIDIICDAWGNETTWELTDDAGNVVASGGPYNAMQTAGTYPQPTVYANLNPNECYSFLIKDSYGDGMSTAQYGLGSFTVTDASGNPFITGGAFTSEVRESFNADGSATGLSNTNTSKLSIYPNPVKDVLTINGIYNSVEIYDIYGKLVLSSNAKQTINVSSLADGVYFVNINTKNIITVKKITVTK